MATKTSLLGLTKPAYTEAADIAVLNTNFDLIDKAVGNGARVQNLLDNSDFRAGSVIAQAGTNGTHGSTKYPLDRWISWSQDIVQSDGYITPGSPIDQYIESYKIDPSATYTAAVGFADGTKQVVSGNFTTGFGSKASGCLYCATASSGKPYVRMQTGFNICWAALYEGAYTAETLPAYVYKGYAAELAECQRYFRKVINAQGYVSAVSAYMFLPYTMRALPSVTINAVGSVRTQGSQVTPTGNYDIEMYADSIRIELAGTYPGKDHAAVLFNADIDLSADL